MSLPFGALCSCAALWLVPRPLSSESAAQLFETQIFPSQSYTERSSLNRQDVMQQQQDTTSSSSARILQANDPQLQFTYGEFPLTSLDLLVDHALLYMQQRQQRREDDSTITASSNICSTRYTFLDVGSGCGRPSLYMALTRTSSFSNVWGMEASERLHQEGIRALQQAHELEYLMKLKDSDGDEPCHQSPRLLTEIRLVHGMAQDEYAKNILSQADLIFCYSTAFDSNGFFLPDIGGMVLSNSWNDVFATHCRPGTIVITTDRCLDPERGWKIWKRVDNLPNPPVLGSTCFFHEKIG